VGGVAAHTPPNLGPFPFRAEEPEIVASRIFTSFIKRFEDPFGDPMIKKTITLLFLAMFLFCSMESVQNVSAGGGGGMFRVMTIPAAAFRPQQDGFTYNNSGYWLQHTSFGGICPSCEAIYFAPVHLPHWAVITGLTAYIDDNNATKAATVDLVEANLATGTVSSWVAAVSSPTGTNSDFTPYSVSGLAQDVDNQNHAYYLRYRTPMEQTNSDEILLGGVQISYIEWAPTSPSYYSITGADFTPFSEQNDYTNSGARLEDGSASQHDYQAGVILPNGARLDQMTFYYYGVSGNTVSANLYKTNLDGDYIYVNSLSSASADGNGSANSTVFASDRVDNSMYAFWIYYRFSSGPIPYGVVIKYTPKVYSTDEEIFSIPAASFVPRQGNYSYQNHGRFIIHYSVGGASIDGAYMAPITPPPNSSVTFMSFMVGNSANSNPGELLLLNTTTEFNLYEMWSHTTLTDGGWYAIGSHNVQRNPIAYPHNAYYLRFNLPPSSDSNWVWAVGARGQWEYKNFLPLMSK
jgi:hypothetical protein